MNGEGRAYNSCDLSAGVDKKRYEAANYYSDKKLCEADARVDTLMRKIRRYAREHNNFRTMNDVSVRVFYDFHYGLGISRCKDENYVTAFHDFVFDESTALEVIDKYKKDLLWYFEEYLRRYSGYYAKEK